MGIFGWIILVIGVLVGVAVLLVVIGLLLPRSHVASRSLTIAAPSEKIWQVITDFQNVPTWHPEVLRVERLPDQHGREIWRETYKGGFLMKLAITERLPPRRLVRTIADEKSPFTGCWEFEIITLDEGSRVAITEKGEIANPLIRLMFRFFMNPAQFLEKYLRALAAKFGEVAVVEAKG
ncbi:MAG TPA: SRPBCC family protein [Gemmataceae bacterium]|nr:SRPBCC family protein [Gemmataceae bacterium]